MTENELREYFHNHRPSLSDDTTYLAGLSAKMDKMAEVKKMSEAIQKQNRLNLAIVFCLGLLVGSAIIAFIILNPISAPQLDQKLGNSPQFGRTKLPQNGHT